MKCLFKQLSFVVFSGFVTSSLMAADQSWISGNPNNDWSTTAANWDSGAVWDNGNNAIFAGSGEVVDVNGAISVGNITFNVFGYEIGDATADGTLTLAGSPSIITVVSGTNTISEILEGSGGLTKNGSGVLALTGAASPSTGNTIVNSGTVQFGATDALPSGSITVNDGATLELTTTASSTDNRRVYTISGNGAGGVGAFVNNAANHGTSVFNSLTLAADATVGNSRRTDANNVVTAGHVLTKIGLGNFNLRSLSGNTMQKLIVNEGLAQFEGVSATVTDGIVVNTNAFMSVMSNNTDRDLNAEVTLNSGALVANWYYPTPVDTTVHFLKPVTAYGDSSLIIGVNSPLANDENSGQSHMNIESGIKGTDTLTLNPAAISNPGNFRVRLLADNSGFKGTLVVDEGYIDVGDTDGGTTGTLNDGPVTVNSAGWLWLNRTDAQTYTNQFSGNGRIVLRHDGDATFDGNSVVCGYIDVANGSLTLANGAAVTLSQSMTLGTKDRQLEDSTISATLTIPDGCSLSTQGIVGGNDNTTESSTDFIHATINQTGGTVTTSGDVGEGNGLRLAHYSKADNVYNMSGGTLTIGGGKDLGIATDGTGAFNMTGGDVFTTRVMLNERTGINGFGTLTVSGGTLHVGSGGIAADTGAPCKVILGNGGGTIKATADFDMSVNATLSGNGSDALTFDPDNHTLTISGLMYGSGDFVAGGTGTVNIAGTCSYSGKTSVNAGTLRVSVGGVLLGSSQIELAAGCSLDLQTPSGALRDDAILLVADDSDSATGVDIAAGVDEVVGGLILGGVPQTDPGTYGSSSSGADYVFDEYFSGGGVLRLGSTGRYWDGTDTTGNADGGNGTWNTVLANWNDSATAGADIVWSNVPPMYAVFGGTAGDVEIEGSVDLNALSFITDGYTLVDMNNDATLNLSGFASLFADSNVTAEITEQLTGTNGFVKTGAGVVVLSGTNTATLSGRVIVNEGTLRWGDYYAMPYTASADEAITVNNGATIDIGALNHFDVSRHYNISGWGVDNHGALYKSGPNTIYGSWTTDSVNLFADSAIGGAVRVDIYGLNLNGFKITKVGPSALRLYEVRNTSGGFDIAGGVVYFESVNQVFEGLITVEDGRYLGAYPYTGVPRSFTSDIVLNGGRIFAAGQTAGIDTSWYGTIAVNGEGSLLCGAVQSGEYIPGQSCNMHVYSEISGTGALYINRVSITPTSTNDRFINLYADNSFTGTVSIGRGLCNLVDDGALRGATQIELGAGVTLDIQNPGDTLGDKVVLVIPDDSNSSTGITLTNGIVEMVGRVVLGGVTYGPGSGSFGSSSSSADNQMDEYFSGTGIVYLPQAQGTVIILR